MRLHPYNPVGRILFRAPVWLYRLGMGWILGSRFLLLTHRGRRSGTLHNTVIEVIKYDPATDTYYVISGFGRRADWFRNICKNPRVTITVGRHRFSAVAHILPSEEAQEILEDFIHRHPLETRLILPLFGYRTLSTSQSRKHFVEKYPVVAFKVQQTEKSS